MYLKIKKWNSIFDSKAQVTLATISEQKNIRYLSDNKKSCPISYNGISFVNYTLIVSNYILWGSNGDDELKAMEGTL